MRRLLGVLALLGVGVLMGFLIRLVWPREESRPVYVPPVGDVPDDVFRASGEVLSVERTAG